MPAPDTVPIITLPSDGDPDNAASVAQAFKALANESAYLKFPKAKASQWEQPIRVVFNARGFRRAYTDHLGYRQFNGIEVNQDWRDWLAVTDWPTSPTLGNPWFAFKTTGTLQTRAPLNTSPAAPLFPMLVMTPPTAAAERVTLQGPGMCVPSNDLGVALKWSVCMGTIGTNRTKLTMGLGDGPSGSGGSAPSFGAWFEKASTDTNWQCKVLSNADGALAADSGVPPVANTFQVLRIDLVGSNVADDSAGHAIFFIDGAQVAKLDLTSLAGMEAGTGPIVPFFNATTTTTGGAAVPVYLGPIAYRHNAAVNAL